MALRKLGAEFWLWTVVRLWCVMTNNSLPGESRVIPTAPGSLQGQELCHGRDKSAAPWPLVRLEVNLEVHICPLRKSQISQKAFTVLSSYWVASRKNAHFRALPFCWQHCTENNLFSNRYADFKNSQDLLVGKHLWCDALRKDPDWKNQERGKSRN